MKTDKKSIIKKLLNGMYLLKRKNHKDVPGYKLYSGNMIPELFISEKNLRSLEASSTYSLFKKDSKERLTLNLSNVRRLHGNHWIKKAYKKQFLAKKRNEV